VHGEALLALASNLAIVNRIKSMIMKNILLMLLCFAVFKTAQAQTPGEWTWMSGSSTPNAGAIFGTQGIPSTSNHPPGLYEVANWRDNQGNFWLYAGIGPGILVFGDLWKFDPLTTEWTWVNGSGVTGIMPVWGVKGVPAATNNPGTRSWGIVSWTDNAGDLWFWGGMTNFGFINDLWKYNIASGMWTWMSGDNVPGSPGNYGVKGVPSINNFPPVRTGETATGWIDSNTNELWFTGGGTDDVWRYSIATNEWTWMAGSNTAGAATVFGTKGIPALLNTPGARSVYTHWTDLSGNFWLFSGSMVNDMWKYDVSINQWAWMSGTQTYVHQGNYTTTCVPDSMSFPASSSENKACWTDNCGNFWLLGGNIGSSCLNDLWRFNPATNEWTWVNGSNTGNIPSVFGTLGVSSPTNIVGSRMGASGYVDANNYLWLYGGCDVGYGQFFADMWRFVPDPACTPCSITPVALFSAPNHICPGTCTDFTNNSINATSYLWTFTGASPSTSTDVNPINICYNTPGTYSVTLIATNASGTDTLMLPNYITVYPQPAPQGIVQSGDTLFANAGAVSYQWYFNGNIINGATEYFYAATASGSYNVVATDLNGCEVEAVIFDVVAAIQAAGGGGREELIIFPNPVGETLNVISYLLNGTADEISVYNMLGEKMVSAFLSTTNSPLPTPYSVLPTPNSLDCRLLPPGIYHLQLTSGEKIYRGKFVKQ
jgi:PKD repeat protein